MDCLSPLLFCLSPALYNAPTTVSTRLHLMRGGTATQCSSTEGSRATTGKIFPTRTEATHSPDGLFVSAAFLPHSCAVERAYNCEHTTSFDEGGLRHNAHPQKVHELLQATLSQQYRGP